MIRQTKLGTLVLCLAACCNLAPGQSPSAATITIDLENVVAY